MMKKLSLFAITAAVLVAVPAVAATNSGSYGASSADLSGNPGTRSREAVNYQKYETRSTSRTYAVDDRNDIYYTAPARRSDLYRQYDAGSSRTTTTTRATRTSRSETARTEAKRKYYLAHPFFQPLKGKFGSVTDVSYLSSSYDIKLTPLSGFTISDDSAKWDMSQFSIKEDLSFGITDKLAIQGMIKYDSTDYKFDWSTAEDDKMDDSGINLYGLGLQWRFVDDSEWIATLSAYYQRQVDVAHFGIADIKAGYKVASSTVYGLARGWYVSFDENSYGNGIEKDGTAIFLAYQTGDDSAFYIEGGLGVFTVLDEDWTVNLEAVFGNYDWHNQASIKGAIGWQPGNSFALNLYGKVALYDSADGKNLNFYWMDSTTNGAFEHRGNAKLDSYSEWSLGLQAILYF